MKYFLDIDGVMVTGNYTTGIKMLDDGFYKFEEDAVNSLNSVLQPNDEIIITSSHRFSYSPNDWSKIMERRGLLCTNISILKYSHEGYNRRLFEILHWVMECGLYPNDILIIDDDKCLNDLPKVLKNRLVLTNSYYGLKSPDEITNILNTI